MSSFHNTISRPPAFTYAGRELQCDSVAIEKLAKQFGTPLYIYSGSTVRNRFQTFDAAFAGIQHTVCYSVKANSNLSILKTLSQLGSGFDIVSGGELERVVRVDKRPGLASSSRASARMPPRWTLPSAPASSCSTLKAKGKRNC